MHYTPEMDHAWQPTPENILDVARHAANTVLRSGYTVEDREDATQVAALGLWQALQVRTDTRRGYAFGIARKVITDWIIKRYRKGILPECSYDALDWLVVLAEQEEETPALDVELLQSYRGCIQDTNKNGGKI